MNTDEHRRSQAARWCGVAAISSRVLFGALIRRGRCVAQSKARNSSAVRPACRMIAAACRGPVLCDLELWSVRAATCEPKLYDYRVAGKLRNRFAPRLDTVGARNDR